MLIINMVEFINSNDFDRFINITIYINGIQLIENEKDMKLNIQLSIYELEKNKNTKFQVFKDTLEQQVKKYVVQKIKENCSNVIDISKKYEISLKNIVKCIFINNKIEHLVIEWSSSSLKEFLYVPNHHYLTYFEDNIYLKINKIKFSYEFIK